MRVRAVGFDLWETLITDTPELSRRQERRRLEEMERILIARGRAAEAVRIERAYRELWRRCHDLYWSADRDIPCRTQIEHFLEALDLAPSSFSEEALGELESAYAQAAVDIPPAAVEGALETLHQLRQRGLRVGLISNTGRTPGSALRQVLRNLHMYDSIEVMVFSNEHGYCKPQQSIFEELRRGLGVSFQEMVFIGDNPYVDVLGAKRCGMLAIHFMPPVRGTAVAPEVSHEPVAADAVVTSLAEVVPIIDAWSSKHQEVLSPYDRP